MLRLQPIRKICSEAFKEGLNFLENESISINTKLASQKNEPALAVERHKLSELLNIGHLSAGPQKYNIPRLHEMTNAQWQRALGPNLARTLAKSYGILQDVLPYETEARVNLKIQFGPSTFSRFGNFITADKLTTSPLISFKSEQTEKKCSVLFLDCDYPDEASNSLNHYILWSKLNIPPIGGEVNLNPGETNELHRYEPPHPMRGSSTHRFLTVLVEHEKELNIVNRLLDVKEVLSQAEGEVVGYSFFRSCWTKAVSRIYSEQLTRPEPVFGELRPALPIRPYKYNNV